MVRSRANGFMNPKVKIHIVPHSHVDLEWYWSVKEIRKMLPELFFNSTFAVLDRDPEMTFAQDQTFLIDMLLKDGNSNIRKMLTDSVGYGRIEIVGGGYVQPELASPSGESLITQIEIGQKFIEKNFCTKARVAWFIDSFGQINQLPQILKQFGFAGYVFMRDIACESDPDEFPTDFISESPDGSRILTHWLKDTYVLCENPNLDYSLKFSTVSLNNDNEIDELKKLFDREIGIDSISAKTGIALLLWGDDLYKLSLNSEEIRERIVSAGFKAGYDIKPEDVHFSTPSEYFEELQCHAQQLQVKPADFCSPLYRQDLRGTYISRINHKIKNRLAENELFALETFAAINNRALINRENYWKPVLYNQFHDLMGGSCLDESYEKSIERYDNVLCEIRESYETLLNNISTCADICLYNPTQFERFDIVSVDEDSQICIHMSPFEIRPIKSVDSKLKYRDSDSTKIENEYYLIEFTEKSGDIKSIYDKESRRYIDGRIFNRVSFLEEDDPDMEGAIRLTGKEIIEEKSYNEFHIEKSQYQEIASCSKQINSFKAIKKVILSKGIRRIDFKIDIRDYPGLDGILCVDFEFDAEHPRNIYESPFAVQKATSDICCAQRWAGVQDDNYLISIINNGNSGYFLDGNKMRLALLRSYQNYSTYRNYGMERGFDVFNDGRTHTEAAKEKGSHSFEYAMTSTGTNNFFDTTREAILFNNPVKAFNIKRNIGYSQHNEAKDILPVIESISGPFIISRMYCDSSNEIIFRGYNPEMAKGNVKICLHDTPWSVRETNLNGDFIKEYPSDKTIDFEINPFKIKTFVIRRGE